MFDLFRIVWLLRRRLLHWGCWWTHTLTTARPGHWGWKGVWFRATCHPEVRVFCWTFARGKLDVIVCFNWINAIKGPTSQCCIDDNPNRMYNWLFIWIYWGDCSRAIHCRHSFIVPCLWIRIPVVFFFVVFVLTPLCCHIINAKKVLAMLTDGNIDFIDWLTVILGRGVIVKKASESVSAVW